MKNKVTLVILSIALLGFTACRKNCCDIPNADFISAQKGIAEWQGAVLSANYSDSLNISGRMGEELLNMRIKFTGTGKYILTGRQVIHSKTIGRDVTEVEYFADPITESVLNITVYNQDTKTISGDFSLNTERYYRYDSLDPYYPKKLAFTKGVFKVQLAK